MAASVIREYIQTQVFNCSEYPSLVGTDYGRSVAPARLNRFRHGIIKSKSTKKMTTERRCTSIAHAIISACRPRSFISPILLSIAVYIHQRYGSRELIDMLNGMSYSDDYNEIQRILCSTDKPSYNFDGLCQFVFDNADFDVATMTGHNTFHAMGCIATPAGDVTKMTLKNS